MLLDIHDLYGHFNGTMLSPQKTIVTNATKTVNPVNKDLYRQDKLIQNALKASIDATIASIVAYSASFSI